MEQLPNTTPETLGVGAIVKFRSPCPVIAEHSALGNVATLEGTGTFTVEIAGDYSFENTCDCAGFYDVITTGAVEVLPGEPVPVGVDCNGAASALVHDQCSLAMLVEIRDAITSGDATTHQALADILTQLQAGILTTATIDGQPIDVNVVATVGSTGGATALDAATLAALEEIDVNVLGQPITVTVDNAVEIDGTVTVDLTPASVTALASAIAGEELTIDDADIITAIEASDDVLERVETTDCNGDPALNVTQSCEWRVAYFASGCDIVSGQIKYNTADGSVLSAIVTHDPSGVLAQGADASALEEIDPAQYPDGLPCAKDDFDNTLKVGQTTTIDVSANDSLCADYADKTYTISNASNVAVVDNGDGTFDVTPAAGSCGDAWSFDYEVSCAEGSATATVSGEIVDELVSFDLNVVGATGVLTINGLYFTGNKEHFVTWPDGTVTSYVGSNSSPSHDLGASSYTGVVTVEHSNCVAVTRLFANNNTAWAISDSNVSGLTSLERFSSTVSSSNVTASGLSGTAGNMTHFLANQSNVMMDDQFLLDNPNLLVLAVANTGSNFSNAQLSQMTNLLNLDLDATPNALDDATVIAMTGLNKLDVTGTNSVVTAAAFAGGVIDEYFARYAPLTQVQVDDLLSLYVANLPTVGMLDLRNTATPSATGVADQATLEAAGYVNQVGGLPIV